jgi:hypothetical protein
MSFRRIAVLVIALVAGVLLAGAATAPAGPAFAWNGCPKIEC